MEDKKNVENDDLLLQQFFAEAAQQEIEDNGFTERVMQQLPIANVLRPEGQSDQVRLQHSTFNVQRFTRLWTLFCIVLFAVLFIVFRGWELLAIQMEVMVRTLAVQSFSINPLMLAVILFGLLFVGVGEVISSETARR
jgi:hypothetical protein